MSYRRKKHATRKDPMTTGAWVSSRDIISREALDFFSKKKSDAEIGIPGIGSAMGWEHGNSVVKPKEIGWLKDG